MVTGLVGEIASESEQGVFARDTRLLCFYSVYAIGERWVRLSSSAISYYAARVHLTNAAFSTEDGDVPAGKLGLHDQPGRRRRGSTRTHRRREPRAGVGALQPRDRHAERLRGHLRGQVPQVRAARAHREPVGPGAGRAHRDVRESRLPEVARPSSDPEQLAPPLRQRPHHLRDRARPGRALARVLSPRARLRRRGPRAAPRLRPHERSARVRRALQREWQERRDQAHLGERRNLPALSAVGRGPRRAPPLRARLRARRLGARRGGAVVSSSLCRSPRQPDPRASRACPSTRGSCAGRSRRSPSTRRRSS